MTSDARNYELAYLLSPSVPEGEVLAHTGKLAALIEEAKGMIRRAEEPRKRKLAYPVKKDKNAYFGWTTFNMVPEFLKTLEKKLKGLDKFLRTMVVEEEIMPTQHILRVVRPRPAAVTPRKIPREQQKPAEEKIDLEALDKKLEEILGK